MPITRDGGGTYGGYTAPKKETLDFFLGRGKYKKKKTYDELMRERYGTRAPSSRTIGTRKAPVKAPVKAPAQAPPPPTVIVKTVRTGGGARYPSISLPGVPDYQTLAREWLAKFPELALPEREREYYMGRAGEEIRPYFARQESKLRRQSSEEEVARLQQLAGRGLTGGVTMANLVDINKRLSELVMEMGLEEESMVGQRATEMEETETERLMTTHAQRVKDWALKYNVSFDAARQTFTDQMSKAGFQEQQIQNAWSRSFAEEELGFKKEESEWQRGLSEREFSLKEQIAGWNAPKTEPGPGFDFLKTYQDALAELGEAKKGAEYEAKEYALRSSWLEPEKQKEWAWMKAVGY